MEGNDGAGWKGAWMLVQLSETIEARDPDTRGHSVRVAALAEAVARALGWTDETVAALRIGGLLHDIGKLAVPREVLRKPGPLTPAEVAQVRRHPLVGARIVEPVESTRAAVPYALCHHERWDGLGYPAGCPGVEVPVEARLLAVVDAFDAMTSPRPYRRPLSCGEAFEELERCAGSQFDPRLVEAFLVVWGTRELAAAVGRF